MNKIVYNSCYGGFSLSQKMLERMYYLGSHYVRKNNKDGNITFSLDTSKELPRDDRILVSCVESMSPDDNDDFSELEIETIKGDRYIIQDYDGLETVIEPQHIKWKTVSKNTVDDKISYLENRVEALERQVNSLLYSVDVGSYYE